LKWHNFSGFVVHCTVPFLCWWHFPRWFLCFSLAFWCFPLEYSYDLRPNSHWPAMAQNNDLCHQLLAKLKANWVKRFGVKMCKKWGNENLSIVGYLWIYLLQFFKFRLRILLSGPVCNKIKSSDLSADMWIYPFAKR